MMKLSLAFRNLFRHRVRTFLSLAMIAGSVMAMIVFEGFIHNTLSILKRFAADNQYGHIQIAKTILWESEGQSFSEKLIDDPEAVLAKIKNIPGVLSASGRIGSFGLISTGQTTFSARLLGIDPSTETGFLQTMKMDAGVELKTNDEKSIVLGLGIARQLKAKVGEDVTIVSQTIDGVVNAADLRVVGIYSTGLAEIDNFIVYVPLKVMQNLLDTKKLENIIIKTPDKEQAEEITARLLPEISGSFPGIEARPWRRLAILYNQVEEFYTIQNGMIKAILFFLMLLGISNTVGMSIYERTGEIGTIRSLGETRGGMIQLFLLESLVLGVLGTVLGFLMSIMVTLAFNQAHLTSNLPGSSRPVSIAVDFVPKAFLIGCLIALITTVVATLFPSRRASKMSIVEALKWNI